MKATGIVRTVDDLGRVVLPKELRRMLRIEAGDSVEFYVEGNSIMCTPYRWGTTDSKYLKLLKRRYTDCLIYSAHYLEQGVAAFDFPIDVPELWRQWPMQRNAQPHSYLTYNVYTLDTAYAGRVGYVAVATAEDCPDYTSAIVAALEMECSAV